MRSVLIMLGIAAATLAAGCSDDTVTQPNRQLRPWAAPSRTTFFHDVRIPFEGTTVLNACNGEEVAFDGQGQDFFRITGDDGGGFHLAEHFNTQGMHGVGLVTGASYVWHEVDQTELNVKYGEEETFAKHVTVISLGPAPNFVMEFLFHVTINANVEVRVVRTDVRSSCPG